MKMEAEIGVMLSLTKEAPQPGQIKGLFFPKTSEEAWPCQHIDFGLRASRNVRK